MLTFPDIDPVAVDLGFLQVRWYGISYVVGILAAWLLLHVRAKKTDSGWSTEQVADLIFYSTIGILLGGRLGSVLFYNFSWYLANPLDIFKVWQGGMSFHGGLIGVAFAVWYFSRKEKKAFFAVADYLTPVAPLGLFTGRIGNFINAELWGRPTDLPWGVVFPGAGGIPRHPSQLYEALLEGIILFIVLWIFSSKPRPHMSVFGLFLILYGMFRFLVEFVREPDNHLGFIFADWMTMGQILSLPMIVLGFVLVALSRRKQQAAV